MDDAVSTLFTEPQSFTSGRDFGYYEFKPDIDLDLRGKNIKFDDALDMAFSKTKTPKSEFNVTKWAKDKYGKSMPVEWKAPNGAEVSVDIGHPLQSQAPTKPHIGWQTAGKRGIGGSFRGHIFLDDVPINRN